MKLEKLPTEEDGFKTYPVEFCGVESYLIVPEISAKWNKHNLYLRSMIVRGSDYEVLSSGWPKFFNYGEKPDAYPDPDSFQDWKIQTKIDGSLCIVDYVNGQFSMRTRGTPSYKTQANANDFEQLLVKYPKVLECLKREPNFSLLFEIVTPNNLIVIPYPEIDFIFLGMVDKNDCSVMDFANYQQYGWMMEVKMPDIHSFKTLSEMVEIVKEWKGTEGVVLSYNDNKNRVKIKAEDYLIKHRLKSELSSESRFIEFYVQEGMPEYHEFFEAVEKVVDFETATAFVGRISKCVDAGKEVKRIVAHMEDFVKDIRNFPTRKEQAIAITRAYGDTNRAGMLFKRLDSKELSKEDYIKLFWQTMKD